MCQALLQSLASVSARRLPDGALTGEFEISDRGREVDRGLGVAGTSRPSPLERAVAEARLRKMHEEGEL
jgi:hypothetical protein